MRQGLVPLPAYYRTAFVCPPSADTILLPARQPVLSRGGKKGGTSVSPQLTGLRVLSCRQGEVVKLEVAEARSEIMAPLSAASMESYSRAYPYLVKLHMLQASNHCTV